MKFRRPQSSSTAYAPDGTSLILPPTSFMERPTLDQFLLLSILWHVLAIVLLGDTSGVGAKLGNRLWGASSFNFNATLNAEKSQSVSGLKLDKQIPTIGASSREGKGDVKGDVQKKMAASRSETGLKGAPVLESAENATTPATTSPEKNPFPLAAELPPVSVTPAVADPQTTPAATPESLPSAPTPPTQSVTPEALRFIAQDVALPVTTFVVAQPAPPREPLASSIPTPIPVPPPIVRAPSQSVAPFTAISSPLATTALPSALTAVPTFNVAPPLPAPSPAPTPVPERILVAPKLPKFESAPIEVRVALPPTPTVATLPLPTTTPVPATVPIPIPIPNPVSTSAAVEQRVDIKIEPRVAVKPPEVKPPEMKPVFTKPTEIKLPDILVPEVSVLPTIANQPLPPVIDVPKLASPPSTAISPIPNPAANPIASGAPPAASQSAESSSRRAPDATADFKSDAKNSKSDPKLGAQAPLGTDPSGASAALPAFPPNPNDATKPVPKLDLDALRNRARAISSEGSGPRTLLPFPVAPPVAVKKKVEEIFDKALKRADCKDAYAKMGLAAVVPLVRDAITEKGCKW